MNQTPRCPKCDAPLAEDAPSRLCPKCLIRAGFASESQAASAPESMPERLAAATFQQPSAEELAERFPQLEVLGFLGKGGMGAVYKARQRQLDRLVALKILPPEVGRDPAFAERFTREAQSLARLSHPNIVAVHDFGRTTDGLFYFIMEYVDGVNLRQAIQCGGMSPQEALAIVPQICEALQSAHDEGIVHRDIKPENVLIDRRGRVKIADFGLAKLLGQTPGDAPLTRTQQVMGTLRYMAPEQMEGTKAVDHRADIYSLGVVFYELLTGELPVGRFAPPSKKVQIDVRLDEVVLRALEKEPEQRYQHASEVKSAIERTAMSNPPPPTQPRSASAIHAADLPAGRLLTAVAGLIGMMTLSAGAALALYGILSESPQAGRFWGWLGGAFGCFFGGSGVLFGAIIRYLHLDGSRDPVTSRSPNGLNRVLGGGALLGGIAIVTALAWSSTGLAVRCSMLLLGTMLIGQSGLFWMLHRRHPRSLQSGGCGKDFPAVPSPPSGPSEGERSLPGACRAATCPTGPATRREE